MKIRGILVAAAAAAVALAPLSAASATTVGGQTVSAGGCDITVASLSYTPGGSIEFTGFNYDCPE